MFEFSFFIISGPWELLAFVYLVLALLNKVLTCLLGETTMTVRV